MKKRKDSCVLGMRHLERSGSALKRPMRQEMERWRAVGLTTGQTFNEMIITENNTRDVSKWHNKEKTGCKRKNAKEAMILQRTLKDGAWALPHRSHKEHLLCSRHLGVQSATRYNQGWMQRKGLCPVHTKRFCKGIKIREWYRFVMRQKDKEGREKKDYA